MLINFLGSPQSGKTTTAAMLFAKLKENHMVAEFVLEQARFKIAENRFLFKKINLTPADQKKIFELQVYSETVMAYQSKALVVSDSSPINNLIYLENWKEDQERLETIKHFLVDFKPLVFLCQPIDSDENLTDMNRIHSLKESLVLHAKYDEILKYFGVQPIQVYGSPEQRLAIVMQTVYAQQFT